MNIYIADIKAYNEGKLIGKWLDLNDYEDVEELKDAIADWMHSRGIEEYAVHDYDDCLASDYFGEYPDLDELYTYHELYHRYSDSFAAWFNAMCPNDLKPDEWDEHYNDTYQGVYDSWEDFARYLIDDCGALGEIPDQLQPYIDYDAFGRDLECSGNYVKEDVYFFLSI